MILYIYNVYNMPTFNTIILSTHAYNRRNPVVGQLSVILNEKLDKCCVVLYIYITPGHDIYIYMYVYHNITRIPEICTPILKINKQF